MKAQKLRKYLIDLPDAVLKSELLSEVDKLEELASKQSAMEGIERVINIGGREIISHICPACNGHTELSHRHCKNCGQKISW